VCRCRKKTSLAIRKMDLTIRVELILVAVSKLRSPSTQVGVISPILFCIYIDDLLVSLSQLGVGCYIAGNFVGAIYYADDIVLISPTPLGMKKL